MNELRSPKFMKTLIALPIILVLLGTMGCQPISRGVKDGGIRENVHMNRLSGALVSTDSGTDGVGEPSFDRGISSFFS